jgi:hypothetical protein
MSHETCTSAVQVQLSVRKCGETRESTPSVRGVAGGVLLLLLVLLAVEMQRRLTGIAGRL